MAKKANTKRNWTIMVYLAGDNNLDGAGVVDLKEMKTVGTTDQVAVLAQFDRAGAKGATIRYCLRKGTPLPRTPYRRWGRPTWETPRCWRSLSPGGSRTIRPTIICWSSGTMAPAGMTPIFTRVTSSAAPRRR